MVGTKCESTTLELSENYALGKNGSIHSLGNSDVCLGYKPNELYDSVKLEPKNYNTRGVVLIILNFYLLLVKVLKLHKMFLFRLVMIKLW